MAAMRSPGVWPIIGGSPGRANAERGVGWVLEKYLPLLDNDFCTDPTQARCAKIMHLIAL